MAATINQSLLPPLTSRWESPTGRINIKGMAGNLSSSTIVSQYAGALNVLNFGADSTGLKDSTEAITRAHATGKLIYYPAGTYLVLGSNIPIPGGGIVGDGAGLSYIAVGDTSVNDTFIYTGLQPGLFENFRIYCTTNNKTEGYLITVDCGSGEVEGMRFHQIMFESTSASGTIPNGIHFVRASKWTVHACQFTQYLGNGILVENQNNGDSGDSTISDCYIGSLPQYSNSCGVCQYSSGGLKIVGTKFNGGNSGYQLSIRLGTSDLVITGCSFENCTNNIDFVQGAVGVTFNNIAIVGNEIGATSSNSINASYPVAFISGLVISSNIISTSSVGVNIDFVTNWTISDNVFNSVQYGILIGTSSTDHNVKGNIRNNIFNGVQFDTIALSGGGSLNSNTYVLKADVQSGTTTVVTNTATGTLFSGTSVISFPTSYNTLIPQNNADITATVTSTLGLYAGVSNITATGATLFAFSQNTGTTVPISWEVRGQY